MFLLADRARARSALARAVSGFRSTTPSIHRRAGPGRFRHSTASKTKSQASAEAAREVRQRGRPRRGRATVKAVVDRRNRAARPGPPEPPSHRREAQGGCGSPRLGTSRAFEVASRVVPGPACAGPRVAASAPGENGGCAGRPADRASRAPSELLARDDPAGLGVSEARLHGLDELRAFPEPVQRAGHPGLLRQGPRDVLSLEPLLKRRASIAQELPQDKADGLLFVGELARLDQRPEPLGQGFGQLDLQGLRHSCRNAVGAAHKAPRGAIHSTDWPVIAAIRS